MHDSNGKRFINSPHPSCGTHA